MSLSSIIELRAVTKLYEMGGEELRALNGVNVTIAPGEFVAIMGPSGSGKSTMMHILGCLDVPTSGSYLLDGLEVGEMDDIELARVRNRKIGFVFQSFNLLSRTTAVENVELPLLYSRRSNRRERTRGGFAAASHEDLRAPRHRIAYVAGDDPLLARRSAGAQR